MTDWTPPAPISDNDTGSDSYDLLGRLHEPWMRQGACVGLDPTVFFPEPGGSANNARNVCADCPVRVKCLEYALTHNLKGVWGGMTVRQRNKIRLARGVTTIRKQRRPAA